MNKKTNSWTGILAILLLLLLLYPIVCMPFLSNIGINWFGLYFLNFGILIRVCTKKDEKKTPAYLFMLFGLIVISIGLINKYGEQAIIDFVNSIGIVLLFLIACIIIGIAFIIGPGIYERNALKRCTKVVIGKCVDIRTFLKIISWTEIIECSPIWQYTINGRTYTYCNEIYDNIAKEDYEEYKQQMIGTTCELFVNPKKPEDVFAKISEGFRKGLNFLGIAFIAGSVIALYLFIFGR